MIVAHLGSGASMCALSKADAASKAPWASPRSMGCRWERGRARSIPAWCSISSSRKGMSAAAVQDLLYSECGLKGLSGVSNDMRELRSERRSAARLCARLFRLSRRAVCRDAGGRAGRPRCVRVHGRHRRELGRASAPASRRGWPGSAPSSTRQANAADARCISQKSSRLPFM